MHCSACVAGDEEVHARLAVWRAVAAIIVVCLRKDRLSDNDMEQNLQRVKRCVYPAEVWYLTVRKQIVMLVQFVLIALDKPENGSFIKGKDVEMFPSFEVVMTQQQQQRLQLSVDSGSITCALGYRVHVLQHDKHRGREPQNDHIRRARIWYVSAETD
ncbi:hypothetical protein JOB18_031088 [Solea senegalensis]|uniref:Uncharacterized protein n=1 Tax=Solea senegalensis TaxID=28829 RepID=A0AAV6SHK1_SOLSE|nr:hypothetical protein JOB18_031088 [Solea senegalensis]